MSHTDTLIANTATAADAAGIQLACPCCRGGGVRDEGVGESQLLPDTQHWQPGGAIVCRNCDQVDLRYGDLIPAILLTRPAAGAAEPTHPTGATS